MLKGETESLLIATQNKVIRTNYVKSKTDKTQQNSKCWFWGYRDETINHIISECNRLAQKENKTRYEWLGKVIHWDLYKILKFDHTNKWYIPYPESILENTKDIKIDHLISVIDQIKGNLNNRLCHPSWSLSKIKRKQKDTLISRHFKRTKEKKKQLTMKVIMIPIIIEAHGTIFQGTGTGRLRNKRKIKEHPNYIIIKISEYTEKRSVVSRRFFVT